MARATLKTTAWTRYAPRAAASVLVVLIALDLGHFVRDIERSRHLITQSRLVSAAVPPRAHGGEESALRIASAHLFGAAAVTAPREESAASQARSRLVLTGVIAMARPQDGYAILGEKDKPTQLYHAGDPLGDSPDVRLYQVFADRAVLDAGGRYETLRLPRLSGIGALLPVVAKQRRQAPWGASASQEIPLQLVTPAESMFANLDAVEDRDAGKLTGMRVHPPKYLRRLYGIEDGDVVTAVNGVAITSPDALTRSLKDSGAAVTLTVVRGGVEQTVSMSVSN